MKYGYVELGHLKRGQRVTVALSGSAANVRLMDQSNYNSYRSGRQHRYQGGLVKSSPWRGVVPRDGRWYVTVDMAGLTGSTNFKVSVEPPSLPVARSASSTAPAIRDVAENIGALIGDTPRSFDVFISHASEDKEEIVRPLATLLRAEGLDVWYDEFELRIGDSLRRKIDHGIANARFGIVVLSPSFFAKGWPNYELDGIVSAQVTSKQIVLPIWHNVTQDDVFAFSPTLAGTMAAVTANTTLEELARDIAQVVAG